MSRWRRSQRQSKRWGLLATTLALIVLIVGGIALFVASRSSEDVAHQANNADSLKLELRLAKGGEVIDLGEGDYGSFELSDLHWAEPITIRSSTPYGATFSAMNLTNVSGFHIESVEASDAIQFRASADVSVTKSKLHSGVKMRDGVTKAAVSSNIIDGGKFGVWIYSGPEAARNQDISISGNDIANQTTDGIQAGNCDRLVVEDNAIHDTEANDDHNDGVQFMGGDDVVIRRNYFANHDQAVLLKAEEVLGEGTAVRRARLENNVALHSRGAGFIVAGTNDTAIINNTGVDNHFADVHIEAENTGLRIVNNVLTQIYNAGTVTPTQEDFNCVENVRKPGAHDVVGKPTLTQLTVAAIGAVGPLSVPEATDACAAAASATDAPVDSFRNPSRGSPAIAGAVQDATPA